MAKIEYTKKGEIAYITLNRPEAMNAVDSEMVGIMDEAWEDFRKDDNLKVAIISSSSKNFCVGFDIKSMAGMLMSGKMKYNWDASSMFGSKNINPVEHKVQKPIIAVLNGNVNGAGLWIALTADIRLATRETSIGLGEVRINFPVEFTGLLTRYLPIGVATDMLITARPVSAERLYSLGVVNALVEQDKLMAEAEAYARDICAGSPRAISVMKELIHQSYELDYKGIMELSERLIPPVVNSQDTMEGFQAFAQKRKANWTGK